MRLHTLRRRGGARDEVGEPFGVLVGEVLVVGHSVGIFVVVYYAMVFFDAMSLLCLDHMYNNTMDKHADSDFYH